MPKRADLLTNGDTTFDSHLTTHPQQKHICVDLVKTCEHGNLRVTELIATTSRGARGTKRTLPYKLPTLSKQLRYNEPADLGRA
jgi:hypothetical protein